MEIVKEIGAIVTSTAATASESLVDREGLVRAASDSIEGLVDEYFDILPLEKALIDDSVRVTIPSVRPNRARPLVPTIAPVKDAQRNAYTKRLCDTLNGWAKNGPFVVHGRSAASARLGIGVAVLQKAKAGDAGFEDKEDFADLLGALERLQKASTRKVNSFELLRGAKVFDQDRLYVVKPIGQRFWTETAALNDADEIAGTILMHTPRGVA